MLVDCPDCEDGMILLFHQFHKCKTCGGSKKIEKKEEPLAQTVDDDDDDFYYAMGLC